MRRRDPRAGPPGPGGDARTRVVVAASSPVLRAGLRALLAAEPAIVVAGAVSLDDARGERIADAEPDVIVIGVETEEHDALPSSPSGAAGAAPPLVVLTDDPHALWAAAGGRGDVRAALPRDATAAEIAAAVIAAAAGLVVLHPSALDPLRAASPPARGDESLTPREVEVLGMLAEGLANKTIAWRLGISEHTVKFHVASIFARLGVSTRTEAVTTAIRRGVLLL